MQAWSGPRTWPAGADLARRADLNGAGGPCAVVAGPARRGCLAAVRGQRLTVVPGYSTAPLSGPEPDGLSPIRMTITAKPPTNAATAPNVAQPGIAQPVIVAVSK